MKHIEIIFKDYLYRFGFWPLILTIIAVLLIIIITIILVRKELRRK